jgi:glucose dehydrogenase
MPNDISADVVVVGAGVVGALMGQRLAKAGASVLILEAGPRLQLSDVVERYRDSPFKDDNMAPIRRALTRRTRCRRHRTTSPSGSRWSR